MKMEIRYRLSARIIWIGLLGLVMVCTSCLIFVYDPLQLIVKKLLTFTPGSFLFNIWTAPPYDVLLKLYIFNVTNSEKFLRGEEKLKVDEIGPYAYKEILTNNNASFNDDGTVSFVPMREFQTDLEHSARDAKLDRIIIPNLPLIGIQSHLATQSDAFTNIAFSTFTALMGSQSLLNLTVHEFLWGYEDKLVKIANKYIPSWIDFEKFGIFERLTNRDNHNQMKISIHPEKTSHRYSSILTQDEMLSPYHIIEVNGSPGLKEWGYDNSSNTTPKKCLLVQGAFEGTIFPMEIKKSMNMKLFRRVFCRPVVLDFLEETQTPQGFRTYKYTLQKTIFASPEENSDNSCYCYQGKCPGRGLQPISACYYDIPIVLSLPHFLDTDQEIISKVDGISPDDELHRSVAYVQPDYGIPLDGNALRIQVNLDVPNTKYNTRTKPFNNITVPLFWIELSCSDLPGFVTFTLSLLEIAPTLISIITYLLGLIGLAMFLGATLLIFFFSKDIVPKSLSITQEYSPLPIISINSEYLSKELRICK